MVYQRHTIARKREGISRFSGILFVLVAVVLWGTVPVGTRMLVRDGAAFSVGFLSVMRLTIAALIFIFMRLRYAPRKQHPFQMSKSSCWWLLIAAGGISLNYIFYGWGLRFTSASVTSVITQIQSPITVLLATALLGERLTKRKILGMTVATLGVLLVVFHGVSLSGLFTSRNFLGNLLEVAASVAWPWYAIGQTKLLEENRNEQTLEPIFVVAALLCMVCLPFSGPLILRTPTVTDWAVLFFLGAGSTAAAYWFFGLALQRLETSEGSMFNVLIPPLALVLAHWVLGEPFHLQVLGGVMLVVLGLLLVVWHRQRSYDARRPRYGSTLAPVHKL